MTNSFTCPICASSHYKLYLKLIDHNITKEEFEIIQCESCLLLQTHPIPKNLDRYYESNQYISHADKPTTLIDKVYFKARDYTMTWKEKLITRSKPLNKTILDYGCGTGIFLKHCADKHWNITGVEPSEQARAIAITNTKASIQPNIISIPQPHFEVITLWHVLEHLRDLNQTLTSLTQKLSKTGTMFIAVPNYKSQDAEFYANFWAAYDVPRHLWHFSKTTMQQLLKQHRLKTTEIIPMKLDAYYVSMLSEKYKHNDHQTLRTLLPAIAIATRSNIMAKRTGEYSSLIYVIRHETA